MLKKGSTHNGGDEPDRNVGNGVEVLGVTDALVILVDKPHLVDNVLEYGVEEEPLPVLGILYVC